MITAIVLLLPHFKDARQLIFDTHTHLHYREYFKEKFRFKAAINKSLNSYNKLNRIPTLNQAIEANITDNENKKNYIYFDAIVYIINSLYVNQDEDFNNCRFELNRNLNTRSSLKKRQLHMLGVAFSDLFFIKMLIFFYGSISINLISLSLFFN